MANRRIDVDELPEVLTPEVIDILVEMAREDNGDTIAWQVVGSRLSERGELDFILEKAYPFKRVKPEELPAELTPEMIESLALMSLEFPRSDAWLTIIREKKLTEEQRRKIRHRNFDIQDEREEQRRAALTPEERKKEDDARQRTLDNPFEYYGNMGEPETRKQYEDRKIAYTKWLERKKKEEKGEV